MITRESRYVRVAKITLDLAEATLPRYSHPKSPHRYMLPQLVACVLLMFYLKLSYRDMEEWLLASDRVCHALGLNGVPDHATLCRAHKRIRISTLEQMKNTLLDRVGVDEETIALDSTGFRTDHASKYYETRRGRTRREFIKGFYAVGTQSQLILAFGSDEGPASDAPFLPRLRRAANRYGRHEGRQRQWVMLADLGFDGHGVIEGDLIPPMRRHGKIVAPERKARADLVAAARLDGLYGQRWKSETVHSVIKRKLGDTTRSRSIACRRREPLVKGLLYNIHVV